MATEPDDSKCSKCGEPHTAEHIEARRVAWEAAGEKPSPYNPCASCAADLMNQAGGITMGAAKLALGGPVDDEGDE